LQRFLERSDLRIGAVRHSELSKLVRMFPFDRAGVSTLAELVNDSLNSCASCAKLVPINANTIVHQAVEVFSGRLDGIALKTMLAENLRRCAPTARCFAAWLSISSTMPRKLWRTLHSGKSGLTKPIPMRKLWRFASRTPAQAYAGRQDKLSCRISRPDRGTGLAWHRRRIVAEHGGSIHVEDNLPIGSRFLVELPAAELTPGPWRPQWIGRYSMTSGRICSSWMTSRHSRISPRSPRRGYHVERGIRRRSSGTLGLRRLRGRSAGRVASGNGRLEALSRLQASPATGSHHDFRSRHDRDRRPRTKLGAFDFIEKPLHSKR